MRILYVLDSFPVISQTFVLNEIVEMLKLGHEIRILSILTAHEKIKHTNFGKYQLNKYLRYAHENHKAVPKGFRKIHRITLNILRSFYQGFHKFGLIKDNKSGRLNNLFSDKSLDYSIKVGLSILDSFNADIIHAHFCDNATAVAKELSSQTGIPYTFSAHGFDIYVNPPADWKESLDMSKFCIVYTQFNKDYLVNKYNFSAEKINVVQHGVDINEFRPSDRKFKKLTIVSVARLHPIKGNEYLIVACSILKTKGLDFQCLLIGDGERKAYLQNMIDDLNLSNCVKILGYKRHDQVARLLRYCHIHVLPSIQESFGVATLEAMACGLAVISSDVQGVSELIQHTKTGFLVQPQNAKMLADCLEVLGKDNGLREKIGSAARSFVEKKYSLENEARETLDLWKDVIQDVKSRV